MVLNFDVLGLRDPRMGMSFMFRSLTWSPHCPPGRVLFLTRPIEEWTVCGLVERVDGLIGRGRGEVEITCIMLSLTIEYLIISLSVCLLDELTRICIVFLIIARAVVDMVSHVVSVEYSVCRYGSLGESMVRIRRSLKLGGPLRQPTPSILPTEAQHTHLSPPSGPHAYFTYPSRSRNRCLTDRWDDGCPNCAMNSLAGPRLLALHGRPAVRPSTSSGRVRFGCKYYYVPGFDIHSDSNGRTISTEPRGTPPRPTCPSYQLSVGDDVEIVRDICFVWV